MLDSILPQHFGKQLLPVMGIQSGNVKIIRFPNSVPPEIRPHFLTGIYPH